MDEETPPNAEEDRLFDEAFDAGRFNEALGALTRGLARQVSAMLRDEGYVFDWNTPPDSSLAFYGGTAAALQKLLDENGEDASYKLVVARDLSAGLFELKQLLSDPLGEDQTDQIARVMIQMVRIGIWTGHLGLATSGLMDEYGELKWRAETLKDKQRQAAQATNARKQSLREAALEQARLIVSEHPDVSQDDLIITIREALPGEKVSISMLGRWVRDWRREGSLPAVRP
jgi:hypothetical protein